MSLLKDGIENSPITVCVSAVQDISDIRRGEKVSGHTGGSEGLMLMNKKENVYLKM